MNVRKQEQLFKLTGFNDNSLKVQKFIEYPCPWFEITGNNIEEYKNYIKTYGEPNHREILQDEIAIDVDAEVVADGVTHANMVEERLKELNIYYVRWKSGGDGEHFHLIFPELPIIFEENILETVKYLLIEFILTGMINPEKLDSHICLFKKKLIQIEYAQHRKGGSKQKVSDNWGLNDIPSDFFPFMEIKLKRKMEMTNKINAIPQPDNLNCINYFNGKTINGDNYYNLKRINYRTLFSLASYFKSKYVNEKMVKKKLLEWYNNIPLKLRRDSVGTVNLQQINILSKRSNGYAGCLYRISLLEELGKDKIICDGCPYYYV